MLVSIVIATYRREKALLNALKSLTKQTYKNIEIIVVDDNADKVWNDKVKKIIEIFEDIHPIVYIKNETNKGSAETRNIGINTARGEYITFLDDDDIYLPSKVENQVRYMIEEKADFSITDLELLSESGKRIETRTREYIKDTSKESLFKYHLMHHITGTDAMMFKKEYLSKIGGFPGIDVGDEFYLMQRAIEEGGKFTYIPTCDIKAYVHTKTDGLSSGESKINGENDLYEFKRRYFNILDSRSIKYIKMRHYAVIAFAEARRKNIYKMAINAIKSFLCSPLDFVNLIINR